MDIDKIKTFYTNKKIKWADSLDYYTPQNKWGERYGYELAKPFTLEEVDEFEKKNCINLPKDFKIYLIQVSKEIFVSMYPTKINLNIDGYSHIPSNEYYFGEEYEKIECCIHGMDICDSAICCSENCNVLHYDSYGGMIEIGNNGCTYSTTIIINGIQIGTVWDMDGNGPTGRKIYSNFTEYINHKIKL
jgi:hypothetical protein